MIQVGEIKALQSDAITMYGQEIRDYLYYKNTEATRPAHVIEKLPRFVMYKGEEDQRKLNNHITGERFILSNLNEPETTLIIPAGITPSVNFTNVHLDSLVYQNSELLPSAKLRMKNCEINTVSTHGVNEFRFEASKITDSLVTEKMGFFPTIKLEKFKGNIEFSAKQQRAIDRVYVPPVKTKASGKLQTT